MTSNQIAFYKAQKDFQTARESIAETNRSNIARETETHRNNVAALNETIRHNVETEFNVRRQNEINELARKENARHNAALEEIQLNYNNEVAAINWQNAFTAMRAQDINKYNAETSRLDLTSVKIPKSVSDIELNRSKVSNVLADTSLKYSQSSRVSAEVPLLIAQTGHVKKQTQELSHRIVQNWFNTAFTGIKTGTPLIGALVK